MGGDQDGRARLGDAVAQSGGRGARFALERGVLLHLRLPGLLEDHHAQAKRHESYRRDQEHELERFHTRLVRLCRLELESLS